MKSTATYFQLFMTSISILLFLSFLLQPAFGQITVNQSSFDSILNTEIEVETITYSDSEPVIPLIEQTGEDQTWDLSDLAIEDSVSSTGILQFFTNFDGKPGADNDHFQDANVMVQSNFEVTFNNNGDEMTINLINYDYSILSESELSSYGTIQAESSDPDDATQTVLRTPKDIIYSLPLTFGDSWDNDYTSEISDESTGESSTEYTISAEVDGWGTLIIGEESIPVLRVTKTETTTISGFDFTSINVGFISENGFEVATLSVDENISGEGYDEESGSAQITTYSGFTPVSAEQPDDLPTSVSLGQNFPNPFNPATQITYQLNSPEQVTLSVYSLTGQKIQTLVNGEMKQTGTHTVSFDAENLASGIYIYRLSTGGQTLTRKMTLLK